jgi:hypothetical protein
MLFFSTFTDVSLFLANMATPPIPFPSSFLLFLLPLFLSPAISWDPFVSNQIFLNIHDADVYYRSGFTFRHNCVLQNYTILITSSPIPSHPSIHFMFSVLQSLYKFLTPSPKNCPLLLVHDMCKEEEKCGKYWEYLSQLKSFLNRTGLMNVMVIFRQGEGLRGLTGNLKNGFRFVNTETVLVLQHDLPFARPVPTLSIVDDMRRYSALQHIRFNKRDNIQAGYERSARFGAQLHSFNGNNYTFSGRYSDQNHFSTRSFYIRHILERCPDNKFMEDCHMWNDGAWLYGAVGEKQYITHTLGRTTSSSGPSNHTHLPLW